jgi:monoamine oxidase
VNVDSVIVGAGAAGIAAGRALAAAGEQALILEARDRVGGRAWTESSTFGFPVDMGCAWLHSADQNPWTAYAREHGFEVIERLPVWDVWVGREQLPEQERLEWRAAFARNEALLAEAAQHGIDVAIADLIPDDKYRPRFDSVVNFLMGAASDQVSSMDYARYADSDINWAVASGLGAVVAHAAAALDVRLNTAVCEIDSTGPLIRVVTDTGTIEARTVIVTVPASILAGQSIRFRPPLPASFATAFEAVSLGTTAKVFLRMARGMLPHAETVHFVRTQSSSRIGSYAAWPSGQEVLLAYFGGSLARDLELRGELESFARAELGQIFGSDFLRGIEQSLATSWTADPWSLGSYSYARPGKARMREQMSEPLLERIFFAGEACSVGHFGTIHGAWHSGVSAADKVLALLDA